MRQKITQTQIRKPQHRRRRRAVNRTQKNRSGLTTIQNPTFIPRGDFFRKVLKSLIHTNISGHESVLKRLCYIIFRTVYIFINYKNPLFFHNFFFFGGGGGVRGLNFPFDLSFWSVRFVKDKPFFLPCKLILHLAKGIRLLLKRL